MTAAPIAIIVHVYTSRADSNGNRYHLAQFIPTDDPSKEVRVELGGVSNALSVARKILGLAKGATVHAHVIESELPRKEWKAMGARWERTGGVVLEHQVPQSGAV